MNRIERTMASAAVRRAPSGRWAGETARRRCIFGCMLAATALMFTVPVGTAAASVQTSLEQWQLRRLNEPSERERAHEREGHVYIYDGLTDREVDQALSAHFKRIYEGWSRFRSEQFLWFRVAEASYDNFVFSSAAATGAPGKK